MRQTLKKTLQPLEIALKKALGIRKVKRGRIFDSRGFAQDSREKITRYILFMPLFQKIRALVGVNEFSNGISTQIATTPISIYGGGEMLISLKPRFIR